jgi:hypothetical protein
MPQALLLTLNFWERIDNFPNLDFPSYRDFYQRTIADDPRWLKQDVGFVRVQGLPIHLLRVEQH